MKKTLTLLISILLLSCTKTTINTDTDIPLNPSVTGLDLNRYLGKWYEIVTIPQLFSIGAKCVTAEYSLNTDGSVKVFNRQIGPTGAISTITGRATVEPNSNNSKLRVTFFGPELPIPNYCVEEIDKDYTYAVVSDPAKITFWILSRTPQMDEAKITQILNRWKAKGIKTNQIRRTVQDCW